MSKKRIALQKQWKRRFRAILEEKGLNIEDLMRLSKALKFPTMTRWYYGTRFPEPASIAALSRAVEMTPKKIMTGIEVTDRYLEEVDAFLGTV